MGLVLHPHSSSFETPQGRLLRMRVRDEPSALLKMRILERVWSYTHIPHPEEDRRSVSKDGGRGRSSGGEKHMEKCGTVKFC